MLRQGAARVFAKYSPGKLQMKREALGKINRQANEAKRFDTVLGCERVLGMVGRLRSGLKSKKLHMSGRSAAW
jgi:hypothetical protein